MTFTTSAPHGFEEGDRVRVSGCGVTVVQSLPPRTISTFSYTFTTGIATITCDEGHWIGTDTNSHRHVVLEAITVIDGQGFPTLFREDGYPIVSIANTQTFEVNAGLGTTTYTYSTGGTVRFLVLILIFLKEETL